MPEQLKFICRKRKQKNGEDVTWINTIRMPYYSSAMLMLYAYEESILYPDHLHTGHKRKSLALVYWKLEYVCEGEYIITLDGNNYRLNPGDLLILHPGLQYHRLNPGKTSVKTKEIMLNNSPLISLLCNRSELNGRFVFHCSDPAAVEKHFDHIRELAATQDSERILNRQLPDAVFSLFNEIIVQCGEEKIYSSFDSQLQRLNAFSPDLTLDRMAKHFNMEKRTLNRVFHKHLTCSPFQYLITMRMNYALQLLGSNTLSIRDVAEECGYRNACHFTAEFKKYFHKTPLEFRKELKIFDDLGLKSWIWT